MQIKPETALVWFSPNIEIATLGFPLILDKKVYVHIIKRMITSISSEEFEKISSEKF